MLHLNSEPYTPGTKGPDQTSDVFLTFTSSLAYMYLIHFRRLDFMSTSMFFLHNKLYHYNWKVVTLPLHPPGLGIPEQIHKQHLRNISLSENVSMDDPKPLTCKVKNICIFHEKQNVRSLSWGC